MDLKTIKAYIPSILFFSLFFPFGLLIMLGSVASAEFSTYVVVGTITFYISISLINSVAQSIGAEREYGRFSLMISSGIPVQLYALAIAFSNGLQTILVSPIIILAGDLFLRIKPDCIPLLAITLILSIFLGSMIGEALAFAIKNIYAINQYSNILSFTLAFFAPVYYPPCSVPMPFRYLTFLEPTTYISRAIYYSYVGMPKEALIWDLGIVIFTLVLIILINYLHKRS
jgi:ABC-2 type transport system permease protein